MSSRNVKAGRNAVIASLLFLAILVIVNFLAAKSFFRIDLTANKEFTISPATRAILGRMDDIVNLKVYFSKDLPSYLATLEGEVADLLDEFRAYAKGNLVVDFEDPSADTAVEERVRRLGIPQIQLDVIQSDSRSIQNAYLGMAALYEDRSETIPVVYSTENLEYELASSIVKVLEKEQKVVGFLTGHGEPGLQEQYDGVRQTIEKQYLVQPVDLEGGRAPVPANVKVLVIAGSVDITEREKYLIDQYLMGGGRLVVLEDAFQLVGGQLQARPIRSGLENLLPAYGARVEEEIALEIPPRSATAGFTSGFMRFMVRYPLWPMIAKEGLSQENPVVSKLESLILPWVSPISESDMKPAGVTFQKLAWTSDQAWTMSGFYDLNPQQEWQRPPEKIKSYTVAAALTGKFRSYFADREVPAAPADTMPGAAPVPPDAPKLTESPDTQILVVGTSHFITANFLTQYPGNVTFFQNALDWMALGNDLIAIRSRAVSDRPLKPEIQMDEAARKRDAIKYAGIFGMPILLTLFGVSQWMARRRAKQAFETSLRGPRPDDRPEGS